MDILYLDKDTATTTTTKSYYGSGPSPSRPPRLYQGLGTDGPRGPADRYRDPSMRAFGDRSRLLDAAREELQGLRRLCDDWDGYGSEAPNDVALHHGRTMLTVLDACGRPPNQVSASAEGGVGLYLRTGDRYAIIECLNTGEIGALASDRHDHTECWDAIPHDPEDARLIISEIVVRVDG